MKSFLMFKDRDFLYEKEISSNMKNLIEDLELETIFKSVSKEDENIEDVLKISFLSLLNDIEEIGYRQDILKDAIEYDQMIERLYSITIDAIEEEKRVFFSFFRKYPDVILHSSIKRVEISIKYINFIKEIVCDDSYNFKSEGFLNLKRRLEKEFSHEYILQLKEHLKELHFRHGIVIRYSVDEGMKGANPIVYKIEQKNRKWFKDLLHKRSKYSKFCIDSKDECGERMLNDIKNQGICSIANTLSKSANHLRSFLHTFNKELAFYIGATRLYRMLKDMGVDMVFPKPAMCEKKIKSFEKLSDITLLIAKGKNVVTNDLNTLGKDIFLITGANRGGKTSFIRALCVAQIMMQIGMFVMAKSFHSSIKNQIFTHFKKEEDSSLKSGKFDEEMKRLSGIIDEISPCSMIVFNESFSSTNEAEASLIAMDIIEALSSKEVEVVFVTHMYTLAEKLLKSRDKNSVFLRAQRLENGKRSYKIVENRPLPTSYGEDLYNAIFKKA